MKRLLFALVLVLLPAWAKAQATEWYGPEYQQCRNGTTASIVSCLTKRTDDWRRRMDSTYQALSARQDVARRNRLEQAQRLWTQYLDANCRFYYAALGTIARIEAAECQRVLTARRTLELEQVLRPR